MVVFFALRGCLAVFFALRGCLAEFWDYGNATLFLSYTLAEFWDWFSIRKRRQFKLGLFIEIVAAFVNLMLGF